MINKVSKNILLKKLTLILNTNNNRKDFIFRFLNYYNSFSKRSKLKIIISDSGNKKKFLELKKKINKKKYNLKIVFLNYKSKYTKKINRDAWGKPQFEYRERLKQVLKKVNTEYLILAADDDFYFPNYFLKALKFLQLNKDYSCLYGHQISFSLKKFTAYGKIIKFKLLKENNPPNPWQEDKNYLDRINNLGKNPWSWFNWYAVQRSHALKETIKAAEKYNIDGYLFEKFFSFCHSTMFRSKKIRFIYCARQENPIYNEFISREPFSYLRNLKSLNNFKKACCEFLVHKHKIANSDSISIVNKITFPDFRSYQMNDLKEIPRLIKKKYFIRLRKLNLLKKITPKFNGDKRLIQINKHNINKEKLLLKKIIERKILCK